MKKILTMSFALILAAAMTIGMTACGSSSSNTDTAKKPATSEAASNQADTSAAASSKADTSAAASSEADASAAGDTSAAGAVEEDMSALTHGYMGTINDDGTTVYMAMNDDISICAFVALSPDGTQNVSFIGQSEVSDAGDVTIHDTVENVDFTFGVTEGEAKDTYDLDMGDLGTAKVAEVDVQDVLDAYDTIDNNTQSVSVNS